MGTTLSRKAGVEEQIGDVKHSILTETQFQSLHGPTWVLMQGQSIAGSDLDNEYGVSILPDARGVFLRGKNNGSLDTTRRNPAGDLQLGQFQSDAVQYHIHSTTLYADNFVTDGGTAEMIDNDNVGTSLVQSWPSGDPQTSPSDSGLIRTDIETRPKNITLNIFIKINR